VYAVATVNFLDHHFQDPSDQLSTILASPENTAHEGQTELEACTCINSLYMSILQESFQKNKGNDDAVTCSILSAVVLVTNLLPLSAIATLMNFHYNQVQQLLGLIQSLLILPEGPNDPVQPFHKSFPDFITDPACCVDMCFHISQPSH